MFKREQMQFKSLIYLLIIAPTFKSRVNLWFIELINQMKGIIVNCIKYIMKTGLHRSAAIT